MIRHPALGIGVRGVARVMLLSCFLIAAPACDSGGSQEDFAKDANATPSGFTATNASGAVQSEDKDDWRTSPFFVGRILVDPAFPNPVSRGAVVNVPFRVLQFEDFSGGLTLGTEVEERFTILDENLDASSPGAYVFTFNTSLIDEKGLKRLFIFDDFGELVSYGDLMIQ